MSSSRFTAPLACLLLFGACLTPAPQLKDYPRRLGEGEYSLTELDLFRLGMEEARSFVDDPRFGVFFENGKLRSAFTRGSVRVEKWFTFGPDSNYFGAHSGSGLLFRSADGIFLLTAGHVLGASGGGSGCSATTTGGEGAGMLSQLFDVQAIGGRDLAILKCKPESEVAVQDSAVVNLQAGRKPRRGEPVVVVGYPSGGMGVTPTGEVGRARPFPEMPLEPIFAFAEVDDSSPFTLRFVAGTVPTGGASGSPVWAADGTLLGVLVAGENTIGYGESVLVRGRCEPVRGLDRLRE